MVPKLHRAIAIVDGRKRCRPSTRYRRLRH
jgi:hypothetical protein